MVLPLVNAVPPATSSNVRIPDKEYYGIGVTRYAYVYITAMGTYRFDTRRSFRRRDADTGVVTDTPYSTSVPLCPEAYAVLAHLIVHGNTAPAELQILVDALRASSNAEPKRTYAILSTQFRVTLEYLAWYGCAAAVHSMLAWRDDWNFQVSSDPTWVNADYADWVNAAIAAAAVGGHRDLVSAMVLACEKMRAGNDSVAMLDATDGNVAGYVCLVGVLGADSSIGLPFAARRGFDAVVAAILASHAPAEPLTRRIVDALLKPSRAQWAKPTPSVRSMLEAWL